MLNGQNKEEEIEVIKSRIQEKLKEKNEDKSFKANISFVKTKENKSSFKNGKNEKANFQIKVFYNNESNSNKSSKKSELIIEKENNNNILSSKELSNEIEKKNNFNFSKFFIINYKVLKIHYLRLNISFLLNNMKINKKNTEKYNQQKLEILKNKILINKLSASMIFLKNSNLINIKRKIAEVMLFSFLEKNKNDITFSTPYNPKKSYLYELRKMISKTKSHKKAKKLKDNDYKVVDDLINSNEKVIKEIYIKIKFSSKDSLLQKQKKNELYMVLEFLIFCKKDFNTFIHADYDYLNYYLLPNALFNSQENNNIEFINNLFAINDIISNKDGPTEFENNNKNEVNKNYQIYKDNKTLKIENALEILFADRLQNLIKYIIPDLEIK